MCDGRDAAAMVCNMARAAWVRTSRAVGMGLFFLRSSQ
jgi:hypothetical protein